MPDNDDKDKYNPENWTGRAAARRFIIWMILWILIEFAIVTWIFLAYGEEGASSTARVTTSNIASSLTITDLKWRSGWAMQGISRKSAVWEESKT